VQSQLESNSTQLAFVSYIGMEFESAASTVVPQASPVGFGAYPSGQTHVGGLVKLDEPTGHKSIHVP